jgi:uncharacterized protein (DUF2235 family)
MSKNIVVCCDGTSNQLHGDLTNVVRMFEVAVKDERQAAFYDPGVGTMADPFAKGPLRKRWSMIKGLAFGSGLDDNVLDAYRYLMRTYEDGDQVFLFGFSRGAFTIRVLAGMLHAVGLLHSGAEHLVPYLWRTYRAIRTLPQDASPAEKVAAQRHQDEVAVIRRSFTRPCPVAFLGPWDTVGSVGMYNHNQAFAFTFVNESVRIVRHAVSLDERRAGFRSNVFKADPAPLPGQPHRPRVMNVWFPGVHCDVGGGYSWPNRSGLAMIAFQWMVREAVAAGLIVDENKVAALLAECPPNPCGETTESLKGAWGLMEYLPARRYDWAKKKTLWRYQPKKPRRMIESPYLHQSVLDRIAGVPGYSPPSLPGDHQFPTES